MDDDRINKDFDDFLKKRYENHNIEPDKALWEGINSRIHQKKINTGLRKVRYLKVAVFSLAAIFAGTIIFFGIITHNGHTENQSAIKITKIIQPSDTTNDNLLSVNNIQGEKADSIINTSTLVSDKTGSVSSGIKTKKSKLSENKIREHIEILSTKIKDTASINKIRYANAVSKRELTVNKINEDIDITSATVLLNSDSLKNKSFALMKTAIRDSATIGINNVKAPEKIKIPIYIEPGSLKFLEPVTSLMPILARPTMDKSINHQILAESTDLTQLSQKSDLNELKSPVISQSLTKPEDSGTSTTVDKRLPFFIEGFVSPEISYREIVVNTKYNIPDYGKTYFNKKEKPDFTYSTGFSGGFGISDNIILRSGVFYSRYSLRFKTDALHLVNNGTDGNFVYTSSGSVNLSFSSSDSLSKESLLKSSLNFSYLNVPLIAEIHFMNNYFINLGFNFNILVGQNMNWQAENYDGNFSNTNSDPIDGLEPINLSIMVGFGTEKHLTRKLSMIVNPSLMICLSSINKTAPVKSYPYVWGLNAGLRYYFD